MELLVISSVKMRFFLSPNSWMMWSYVSRFRVASSALLTRA